MQSTIVILGTGGTIAGSASSPHDNVGYRPGTLGVERLVAAVPAMLARLVECEQVAQVDSKDMTHALWQRLAQRVSHHLARDDVAGVVVTHGTDTLEETGYFLHRVLAPGKPVVLTAAMRPATALSPDGPQNLLDAVTVAATPGARGVVVALAGRLHGAADVTKVHSFRVDAFGSRDAGPLACIEEGRLRMFRSWPEGPGVGLARVASDPQHWPPVEIVTSHAGAGRLLVDSLVAQGVRGIVVAGTGNGRVHETLAAALHDAQARGVRVVRATRCPLGAIVGDHAGSLPSAGALSPVKARIELLLELLGDPSQ
jgi:L-asparaginase